MRNEELAKLNKVKTKHKVIPCTERSVFAAVEPLPNNL